MSNVSYDLDTSGGLMPLIRALIKPPDEELNTQKPKKPQHPYYKRPGKGHNHDSCDACGEGGDLICCDRCPASFHLGCYDPPLDENDIPAGQWLCRECRASDAEKPSSARGSRAQSPADNKSDTDKKSRTLRNNRANSAKKKSKEEEEEEVVVKKEEDKELTPMEVLVKAARIMNPRQFELPPDMRVPCIFPGTDKEGSKNGNASLVSVDAWGCVPLPAKLCFVCQNTCKVAPLLQCDYCPLLFHQDCLDPPLTALPTGRWMCPNHVEQYIDWKLVNSISATERVALWDKFSGPVDQHAIKIDFIRRARNARPAFRTKVPVGVKGRVIVPDMVRYHYRRPPPLLPSRREYVRCNKVLNTLRESKDYDDIASEENTEAPKHKICLNLSCPLYSAGGPCRHEGPAYSAGGPRRHGGPALRPASDADAAQDLQDIAEDPKVDRHTTESSSDLSDSDFEYFTASVKRRKVSPTGPPRAARAPRAPLQLRDDDDVAQLLECVDSQLHQLDERLVRLLAWQRLQQVSFGEQCYGSWSRCGVSAQVSRAVSRAVAGARLAERGAQLPSALLSLADRTRITAAVWGAPPPRETGPPRTVPGPEDAQVRATFTKASTGLAQLPSALLSLADRTRITAAVWGALPPRETGPPRPVPGPEDAQVRATFTKASTGLNGSGDLFGAPIPMRRACATVGSDSGCDVVLPACCRHVSPHHATIFMDEVTRHFELINYSEWGSVVNGVLYACELGPREAEQDSELHTLRELVSQRARPQRRLNGELTVKPADEVDPCRCTVPSSAPGAWEGSALVPHGALLAFGCHAYVFSVTDYLAYPYEVPEENPAL